MPEIRLLMASLQKCVAKFPEQPWSMSFAVWVGGEKKKTVSKFQRKLNNREKRAAALCR